MCTMYCSNLKKKTKKHFPLILLSLLLCIGTKREVEYESKESLNHAVCIIAFGFSLNKNLCLIISLCIQAWVDTWKNYIKKPNLDMFSKDEYFICY